MLLHLVFAFLCALGLLLPVPVLSGLGAAAKILLVVDGTALAVQNMDTAEGRVVANR